MARKSYNPPQSLHRRDWVKAMQKALDSEYDKRMGKWHRFTIFRMGMDACAKCGKSRKDHLIGDGI